MTDIDTYEEFLDYLDIEDFGDITLFVEYTNKEGDTNQFRITDISISDMYGNHYIDAFCIDKDGEYEGIERTFRIDRFDDVNIDYEDDY